MRKTMSRSIAVATAAATMLSAVAIQPVAAAPLKASEAKGMTQGGLTDVSSQQRRYRRGGNANAAVALGAVGLVFGTIAGLAAADQRRQYQQQYYGGYGYQPYAYAPPPAYYGHPGYYGYR